MHRLDVYLLTAVKEVMEQAVQILLSVCKRHWLSHRLICKCSQEPVAEEAQSKTTVSSSICCSETANYFVSSSFLMQWCLLLLCQSTWACCCQLPSTPPTSRRAAARHAAHVGSAHCLLMHLQQSLHLHQLHRAKKQLT